MGGSTRESQEWLPDEVLDIINTERVVREDEPGYNENSAKEIMRRAAPGAARSVSWLAMYSNNEQVRLKASQYVLDGVLGGKYAAGDSEDDVIAGLLAKLVANDVAKEVVD